MSAEMSVPLPAEIDGGAFRRALGCFPTGVALLTSGSGHEAHAITVNSFVSVSLDPPLILVGVKESGRICPLISRRRSFAVNVLADDQRDVSSEFARSDRIEGGMAMRRLRAVPGVTGDAIVPGAVVSLACELWAEHPGGDHVLFIGRVVRIDGGDAERPPLLFHRSRYAGLS